jgi:DNA-binding SARP family transcriptional activator
MARAGQAPDDVMPDPPSSSAYALVLIDRFELSRGGLVVALPQVGQRLLALLALEGSCTRSFVSGTLWPDAGDEHASASLRTARWRLRRQDLAVVRETAAGHLQLAPAVSVDLVPFAARTLRLASRSAAVRTEDLDVTLLRARELLPGWDEDWVLFERERLRQLRLHALEALCSHLVALGRHAEALDAALEALRAEPLRESAHAAVLTVHLAEHNVGEALLHFERFRAALLEELGIEPSAGLRAMLHEALRPVPSEELSLVPQARIGA